MWSIISEQLWAACGVSKSVIWKTVAVVQVDILTLTLYWTRPLRCHITRVLNCQNNLNIVWSPHCHRCDNHVCSILTKYSDFLTKLNFQYGRRGCCCWEDCCHVPAVPVVVLWGVCCGSNKYPQQPTFCLKCALDCLYLHASLSQDTPTSVKITVSILSRISMHE